MPINNNTDMLANPGGVAGQIADSEASKVRTGVGEETIVIPFGFAVCRGTADNGVILPADANSQFLGVATLDGTIERREGYSLDANSRFGNPVRRPLGYLHVGTIWVPIATNVDAGDQAFWVHTTNGASLKGMFRNDADTANAVEVPGAQFLDTALAGGVSRLSLNLA